MRCRIRGDGEGWTGYERERERERGRESEGGGGCRRETEERICKECTGEIQAESGEGIKERQGREEGR